MPRRTLTELPDLRFTFLESHMWIVNWRFDRQPLDATRRFLGVTACIGGLLKPEPNEGGGRVIRRMFMDVLDQALDAIHDAGILHTQHPDVRIKGEVLHSFDKPDDFANMQCEVEFHLWLKA